jgi:3-oxoacyl-[acyl-carrier protein] reductase
VLIAIHAIGLCWAILAFVPTIFRCDFLLKFCRKLCCAKAPRVDLCKGEGKHVVAESSGVGYGWQSWNWPRHRHAIGEGWRARSYRLPLQQTLRQMQVAGADCVAVETDISDAGRAEQLVQTVVDRFGRLDLLVNNVGDFRWGTLSESSLDDWKSIFVSNLMTVVYVSRAALPHMRKGRWGRIVNMGAVGAERAFGQAKISAYAAAKAAVVALSRSLALEEAKNGITVNVVNPSSIDENELTIDEARKIRDARFPIGRPPTTEDVAAAVAFFASEEAEYVTGQVVNVSGGWML